MTTAGETVSAACVTADDSFTVTFVTGVVPWAAVVLPGRTVASRSRFVVATAPSIPASRPTMSATTATGSSGVARRSTVTTRCGGWVDQLAVVCHDGAWPRGSVGAGP